MINSYDFGEMVIEGKKYTSDLIIYPDRIKKNWWRREGHKLHGEDIEGVFREKPEVFIFGTGNSGLLEILPRTRDLFQKEGIEVIAQDTKEARETYNRISSSRKVVAAFHLTC